MSPEMISVILWVPFIVVLLITGFIFCRKGYQQGIWRALISVGATLISACISFFISKLVAGSVAGNVKDAIVASLGTEDAMTGVISVLIPNIVQAFAAIFLFAIIFFVFTIILKLVSNAVKPEKLLVEEAGLKWAGVGVRAMDALLYALLLFLPIYGTFGAYVPTATSVLKMFGETDATTVSYLEVVAEHPLVVASNNTPVGMVYNQLAKVDHGDAAISIPEIVDAVSGTAEKFTALTNATEENFDEACLDLVSHLKENVVDTEWSYAIVKELLSEGMVEESGEAGVLLDSLKDLSQEEYQKSTTALLDLAEYALKNDVLSGETAGLQTEEFYELAAETLNATDMTVKTKEYLVEEILSGVCGSNEEAAATLLNAYDASAVVGDTTLQKQEIEAIMSLTAVESIDDVKTALKKIPSLDKEAVDSVIAALKAEME